MADREAEENDPSDTKLAEEFKNGLLENTTARGRASIERVWTACCELIAAGKPITVSAVGRITKERWGGPKEQGIRDQPDRLKRLVDLCAASQKETEAVRKRGRSKSRGEAAIEELVAEVRDQTTRVRIRAVAEERNQLRRDLLTLRKAYGRLTPIAALTPEQCYDALPQADAEADAPETAVLPAPAEEAFTEAERDAVRRFLDEEFLFDEGFKIDEVRGLLSEQGRIVLPLAFVTALRKVIDD
ncbi:gamma-mobile-trio protein GmtX [Methylosinus sp. PW1]|uniref:gamma-mobile-trio protein GmtX n=1 Tax=Methylosinus sp. PW1 TaxID=107636 RepID=UPI00055DF935|nr:gamma-mobile-trio protein GmtX [Methylosinus sp. PW1]